MVCFTCLLYNNENLLSDSDYRIKWSNVGPILKAVNIFLWKKSWLLYTLGKPLNIDLIWIERQIFFKINSCGRNYCVGLILNSACLRITANVSSQKSILNAVIMNFIVMTHWWCNDLLFIMVTWIRLVWREAHVEKLVMTTYRNVRAQTCRKLCSTILT